MQSVGSRNVADVSGNVSEHRQEAVYQCTGMRPEEVQLELQVLLGGLLISGVLLMVINAFGL